MPALLRQFSLPWFIDMYHKSIMLRPEGCDGTKRTESMEERISGENYFEIEYWKRKIPYLDCLIKFHSIYRLEQAVHGDDLREHFPFVVPRPRPRILIHPLCRDSSTGRLTKSNFSLVCANTGKSIYFGRHTTAPQMWLVLKFGFDTGH